MPEKIKRVDKKFILSDSSVNEYGFRLLSSGYQLAAFEKNPIGYYMHQRDGGVVLKWQDLAIEGDNVTGYPCINLSNERGQQTCDEVEAGFLNAASVGHIVVLDYSTDAELMLPGQTGPTITKWYNKECSLVDLGGNENALALKLYDAQEIEINLADFSTGTPAITLHSDSKKNRNMKKITLSANSGALLTAVNLTSAATDAEVDAKIPDLIAKAEKADQLELANTTLKADNVDLKKQLTDLQAETATSEITAILDKAVADKKITVELKATLAADYAKNPKGLKKMIEALPAYTPIVTSLAAANKAKVSEEEAKWSWDDYEKNDPNGKKLTNLKAENPEKFKEIFDARFTKE